MLRLGAFLLGGWPLPVILSDTGPQNPANSLPISCLCLQKQLLQLFVISAFVVPCVASVFLKQFPTI